MKEIINPTKEQIEEYLNKIGWKLRHFGCEHYYFISPRGRNSRWLFYYDRIEQESVDFDKTPAVCFYLKDCAMVMIDDDCVCIGGKDNKSIFVQFRNYKIKKEKI